MDKPTRKLSEKQARTLKLIDQIDAELDKHNPVRYSGMCRWFIQAELHGVTLHTMKALVEKEHLEEIDVLGYPYYRVK